ncbi:MAG: Gfo/Idh/MocA family protein [Tepidisphaeraceae bacterium]
MSDRDLTRRSLLMAGGAGILAAALPTVGVSPAAAATTRPAPATPLAPPDKQPPHLDVPQHPHQKLRWAIVGLGELALGEVLPAFAQSEHARVTALVSGHPDKARKVADYYGVDPKHLYTYDNYDAIAYDDQIDIVYVILPNHMHAEYTVRALKAGKHVLCEKPMATTVAECQRMIDAAKQTNKKLMIAYRLHYEPYNLKAVELLRSNALGKIKVIEASNLQNTYPPNIRLSKKTGGGPLGDVGIYCLNAARYLTGEEPIEVSAMLQQPANVPRFAEVPESVIFQLRFPSGALAMCACGFGSEVSSRFRVNCDNGWLELDPAFKYTGQRMTTMQNDTRYQFTLDEVNQFAAEMDHFSQCVMHDKPPSSPGEEGLRDMAIIARIREAADSGKALRLA